MGDTCDNCGKPAKYCWADLSNTPTGAYVDACSYKCTAVLMHQYSRGQGGNDAHEDEDDDSDAVCLDGVAEDLVDDGDADGELARTWINAQATGSAFEWPATEQEHERRDALHWIATNAAAAPGQGQLPWKP